MRSASWDFARAVSLKGCASADAFVLRADRSTIHERSESSRQRTLRAPRREASAGNRIAGLSPAQVADLRRLGTSFPEMRFPAASSGSPSSMFPAGVIQTDTEYDGPAKAGHYVRCEIRIPRTNPSQCQNGRSETQSAIHRAGPPR